MLSLFISHVHYSDEYNIELLFLVQCLLSCTGYIILTCKSTTAWLAQLGERRFAEQEVAGSIPGRTTNDIVFSDKDEKP